MTAKRYRRKIAKPGQLRLYYGKMPHDNPDVIIHRGDGVPKCDGHLLYNIFSGDRPRRVYCDEQQRNFGDPVKYDPGFIKELQARGYDIETIEFSIMKKQMPKGE